ncbi:Asp23/Gls24 family envelope stress response protein [Anoxybacteroides tepidamans]|uniref:Asp23/Gls24 family envelope stress response protein n=1 Tax=Anoxybacteroides tepidamans TaxID=265948 RepID=UPI00047F9AC5|nr:Asp23/Gls24 family envelope stress response protein [Anoxybacillus tepidamans]
MKGAARLRRSSAAYLTLVTIATMCLREQKEIVLDETTVDVLFHEKFYCTIAVTAVIKYGAAIIPVCEKLQEQIAAEIQVMTPFVAKHVHIFVKRLADAKINA